MPTGAVKPLWLAAPTLFSKPFDIASALVFSDKVKDYLHLIKQNNEWRIINSLQGRSATIAAVIEPAALGQKMPDFTLPGVHGKNVSISGLKGRNVLIIFPRGRVGDHWCQVCHYQYAELADLEKRLQLRKKYNLEILFVLPYDQTTVEHWLEIFPEQMAVIEGWKTPPDQAHLDEGSKKWMETARRYFPKKFDI